MHRRQGGGLPQLVGSRETSEKYTAMSNISGLSAVSTAPLPSDAIEAAALAAALALSPRTPSSPSASARSARWGLLSTLRSTSTTSTTRALALLSQAGLLLWWRRLGRLRLRRQLAARQLLRGNPRFRGECEHIPVGFWRAHCAASPVVTAPSKKAPVLFACSNSPFQDYCPAVFACTWCSTSRPPGARSRACAEAAGASHTRNVDNLKRRLMVFKLERRSIKNPLARFSLALKQKNGIRL
jgi:hypothetical protein